jgi:hypothetical protein
MLNVGLYIFVAERAKSQLGEDEVRGTLIKVYFSVYTVVRLDLDYVQANDATVPGKSGGTTKGVGWAR